MKNLDADGYARLAGAIQDAIDFARVIGDGRCEAELAAILAIMPAGGLDSGPKARDFLRRN